MYTSLDTRLLLSNVGRFLNCWLNPDQMLNSHLLTHSLQYYEDWSPNMYKSGRKPWFNSEALKWMNTYICDINHVRTVGFGLPNTVSGSYFAPLTHYLLCLNPFSKPNTKTRHLARTRPHTWSRCRGCWRRNLLGNCAFSRGPMVLGGLRDDFTSGRRYLSLSRLAKWTNCRGRRLSEQRRLAARLFFAATTADTCAECMCVFYWRRAPLILHSYLHLSPCWVQKQRASPDVVKAILTGWCSPRFFAAMLLSFSIFLYHPTSRSGYFRCRWPSFWEAHVRGGNLTYSPNCWLISVSFHDILGCLKGNTAPVYV